MPSPHDPGGLWHWATHAWAPVGILGAWKNWYHGTQLQATRGTTQGGLISPTLLNIIVDNVVQNWIALTVEDEMVANEGLGLVV